MLAILASCTYLTRLPVVAELVWVESSGSNGVPEYALTAISLGLLKLLDLGSIRAKVEAWRRRAGVEEVRVDFTYRRVSEE